MINKKYADIIDLPHHSSERHPRMSAIDRAAQFSPFAALTGYEDAIDETGRLTDEKIELSEDEKQQLNAKLAIAEDNIGTDRQFAFTYFVQDKYKNGGAYVRCIGSVKKFDLVNSTVFLTDQTIIPIENITAIEER